MNNYLNKAIDIAFDGIQKGDGGPFGAVIIKDNKIVGVGNNKVLINNDPTAHAEVVAIRDACKNLKTFDLSGCVIYSTSEPCPMCLASIIWANIKEVYYGTNRKEVAKIGFRDDMIYNYLEGKDKNIIKVEHIESERCKELLNEYKNTIY